MLIYDNWLTTFIYKFDHLVVTILTYFRSSVLYG